MIDINSLLASTEDSRKPVSPSRLSAQEPE